LALLETVCFVWGINRVWIALHTKAEDVKCYHFWTLEKHLVKKPFRTSITLRIPVDAGARGVYEVIYTTQRFYLVPGDIKKAGITQPFLVL